MDKPLLALTRPHRDSAVTGPATVDDSMGQLVQLRWLAVAGQLAAILAAHFGLGVELPLAAMLAIVALLAAVNVGIMFAWRHTLIARSALSAALAADMIGLTAQLYLSGGTANPFVSLYLLQIALGAILLPIAMASALAAASVIGVAALSIWRRPLALPASGPFDAQDIMMAANWLAFAMVAGLLVIFVVRISRNLRARDAYLAQLREREAQEEGVLRVGLFASGAAHELGTPLSSLAVLVGDWQRHPQFRDDPELLEELGDAAAELQRCKDTVSRVLEAAGQSRGEAMGGVRVHDLLSPIADDWTAAHGDRLQTNWQAVGDLMVVREPSLHQAITSLLENAREAHSPSIELSAAAQHDKLAITIRDRGVGFNEELLARVGRPLSSDKGPGHGVGLFLAATVARRLGGRLDVRNRKGGGAAVSIVLPIVGGL